MDPKRPPSTYSDPHRDFFRDHERRMVHGERKYGKFLDGRIKELENYLVKHGNPDSHPEQPHNDDDPGNDSARKESAGPHG